MGLRILMASDFYSPHIGGTERQVQILGQQLVRRGHEVGVATVWHPGLPERDRDDGVPVFRLKGLTTSVPWFYGDPKRRFPPPFPDPGLAWGLRRLVERVRPDVVHAHGWIAYSCAAALIGKRTPLLVSVRDYGYSCAIRSLQYRGGICSGPGLRKCLECASERYGAPKAAGAVAGVFGGRPLLARKVAATHSISHFVQRIVRRDLLAELEAGTTTSRAVTIHDFVLPPTEETNKSAIGGPKTPLLPTEPFILFVGALQQHKGINLLLAAYERLASPPPLVLIGTPWPDSPKTFPPGVRVLRNVPHHQVMVAWERCLFGVVPSIWAEPFGGVTTEAMSQGKAVVGTAVGGAVEIVADGETGLLVTPGDVDALAAAMQRLIEDPERRERFGRAARERVQRLFSVEAALPRFEAVYEQLAGITSEAA